MDNILAEVAGMALSIIFAYVPGAKDWFEGLGGTQKRLTLGGLILVVTVALFFYTCQTSQEITCTVDGALKMAEYFIKALIASQATYTLMPRKE